MKKLLKSEVCGSREQHLFTREKSTTATKKKKKRENAQEENAVNKLDPNTHIVMVKELCRVIVLRFKDKIIIYFFICLLCFQNVASMVGLINV